MKLSEFVAASIDVEKPVTWEQRHDVTLKAIVRFMDRTNVASPHPTTHLVLDLLSGVPPALRAELMRDLGARFDRDGNERSRE
jgi:hypothetical protein